MIELKYQDDLKFQCNRCDQPFTHLTVNLSVLMYGVAVLQGQDRSYLGLKCPSCLKTLLIECDNLYMIFEQLNTIVSPTNVISGPLLKYNSSVTKDPFTIPHLKGFDIFCYPMRTREGGNPTFEEDLVAYRDEKIPHANETLISTYILDPRFIAGPIGPYEFVSFYFKKDLEDLVKIENVRNIRVFPRYVYNLKFYRRLNEFCWEYCLRENDSGDTQDAQSQSFLAEASFLSLLLDDPHPFYGDLQAPAELKSHFYFYSEIWKFQNPFKDRMAPTELSEVANCFFEPPDKHTQMVKKIRENQRKAYVLEFLSENYLLFGKEFIALAQQGNFCYGHIWELKLKYLRALHGIIEQGPKEGLAVSVHPQGSSLTINFGGGIPQTAASEKSSQAPVFSNEQPRQALKTPRHSSKIKKKVRLLAEQLWDEDPSITIADMVVKDELSEIALKKNNELYSEETLKGWIKDLAPNRSPGRRPKKG